MDDATHAIIPDTDNLADVAAEVSMYFKVPTDGTTLTPDSSVLGSV